MRRSNRNFIALPVQFFPHTQAKVRAPPPGRPYKSNVYHARKKAGETTSATYQRGWDGTLLSYSLQGPKPPGNPCAYRLPISRISFLSSVDAFVFITDQFCFSPSSILDALCFHPPPTLFPNLSHTSSSLVYTEVCNLIEAFFCALTFTGLTF